MGQTKVLDGPVDVRTLPAGAVKGGFQMFADAAACDALLGEQNYIIARNFFDKKDPEIRAGQDFLKN